ncbi:phytoene synthase [Cohaesibacter sp. ES.047]|uniref:squalene/phytoene synthase family protein n=1 Tax=Cohaesibacter sp. ES.047 TaxID=1798205 RepID=UPI000BB93308|nr:squalene/phytoene synthase family protein [Cohaesibacter sp. ES.047]SNY93298.1 phytoene synthase [Cohaesibacter sp. ES.047]
MARIDHRNATDPSFAFCQTEVKRTDPLAHFIALVAPDVHRPALMVLYAFLAEIARLSQQISEPAMGEIRLQWWKDTLEATATGDTQVRDAQGCGAANIGPLASAIRSVIRQYQLPLATFTHILEARRFDLYNDPMPDLAAYETYAGETGALPLMLAAQILNDGKPLTSIADLSGHAGMAISLSNHLYNWQRDAGHQRLFLPVEVFSRYGLSTNDIWAGKQETALSSAIRDLCQLADAHHSKAIAYLRPAKSEGQAHLLPAYLMLAPAALLLKKREKAPLAALKVPNWRLYASVVRMAALG